MSKSFSLFIGLFLCSLCAFGQYGTYSHKYSMNPKGIGYLSPSSPEVTQNFTAGMFCAPGNEKCGDYFKEGEKIYMIYGVDTVALPPTSKMRHDFVDSDISAHRFIIYEQRRDYLKVFWFGLGNSFWVSKIEMQALGFKFKTWKNYFDLQSSIQPAGFIPVYGCSLPILKKPEEDAQIVTTMNCSPTHGPVYYITFTGKFEGIYAQVKVVRYWNYPCTKDEIAFGKFTGWIEPMNKDGGLNVYRYPFCAATASDSANSTR